MGIVYRATDPRIGRPVAIKVLTGFFSEDSELLARFYREAKSTGSLQHQNIVVVDISPAKREDALAAGATKVVDGAGDGAEVTKRIIDASTQPP